MRPRDTPGVFLPPGACSSGLELLRSASASSATSAADGAGKAALHTSIFASSLLEPLSTKNHRRACFSAQLVCQWRSWQLAQARATKSTPELVLYLALGTWIRPKQKMNIDLEYELCVCDKQNKLSKASSIRLDHRPYPAHSTAMGLNLRPASENNARKTLLLPVLIERGRSGRRRQY